jgi:hypothetical protein
MEIPEKFPEVIRDFLADLSSTFPEYTYLWGSISPDDPAIYQFCLTTYPERFFDILYQNEDIFFPDSEANTMFLPMVDFKLLFTAPGISENTKQAIWKYLQLVLITIMGNIKTSSSFGDTAGLFEGIGEEELQSKLSETIEGLTNFFKGMKSGQGEGEGEGEGEGFEKAFEEIFEEMKSAGQETTGEESKNDMPSADDLHNHIKGLFDGKIGKLAKELAEELSGDVMNMFDDGTGRPSTESATTADILKKMMKNPKKIMELVKKIGTKLDDKMKTGDVSQEEIMKEVGELMTKMKGSGQGKDFEKMMKTMMKGMGLGDAGLNMGKMNDMMSKNSHKERMLAKLEARRQAAAQAEASRANVILEQKDAPNEFVFKVKNDDGVQEKSRATPPLDDWLDEPAPTKSQASKSSKSQKGKKGKK